MKDEDFSCCYEAALRFLDYRPRSEAELREHLLYKRKCGAATVKSVIVKLKKIGLVDDRVFARNWVIDRVTFKQKSGAVIRYELLKKGIDAETADLVTADIDDEANALKAGIKKARLLSKFDFQEFNRRLAPYLGRRGYGGEVIHRAIPLLWETVNRENLEK
jgi:regulatory protein